MSLTLIDQVIFQFILFLFGTTYLSLTYAFGGVLFVNIYAPFLIQQSVYMNNIIYVEISINSGNNWMEFDINNYFMCNPHNWNSNISESVFVYTICFLCLGSGN